MKNTDNYFQRLVSACLCHHQLNRMISDMCYKCYSYYVFYTCNTYHLSFYLTDDCISMPKHVFENSCPCFSIFNLLDNTLTRNNSQLTGWRWPQRFYFDTVRYLPVRQYSFFVMNEIGFRSIRFPFPVTDQLIVFLFSL